MNLEDSFSNSSEADNEMDVEGTYLGKYYSFIYKSLYLELTGDDTIELHFEDSSNTLNLDSSFERSQVWGSN